MKAEQSKPNGCSNAVRMWSCRTWVLPSLLTRSELECSIVEGESPVEEGKKEDSKHPEYYSLGRE